MTAFVAVVAVLFLAVALLRVRVAFFLYVFAIPFLAPYFAIPLVEGGAGISLRRIGMYCLALGLMANVHQLNMAVHSLRAISKSPYVVAALGAFFLPKLISTLLFNTPLDLLYWLDEVIEVVVCLVLGVAFLSTPRGLAVLVRVIVAGLLLSGILVAVELYLQHNLLLGVVDVSVSTAGEGVLDGRYRDGRYRSMSLFDNPLSLSEFCTVGITMALLAIKQRTHILLACLALFSAGLILYGSQARTGLLVAGMIILGYAYMHTSWRLGVLGALIRALMAFAIVVMGAALLAAIINPELFVSQFAWLLGNEEARASTLFRLQQYPVYVGLVSEGSVFGYGMKLDVVLDGGIPLDNFFLKILLQGGVVSLLGFIVLVRCFYLAVIKLSKAGAPAIRIWTLGFGVYWVSFVTSKFFLSMNYNNLYFYIVLGALIGLAQAGRNSKLELAPLTR